MLVREVSTPDQQVIRLTALAQFLLGRARDTGAQAQISTESFIRLAAAQGISLTINQLKELSTRPPLSNIIADVTGSETDPGLVIFRGDDIAAGQETMTVDQARETVDSMARRAAKKDL